jgi:hypothetical protein
MNRSSSQIKNISTKTDILQAGSRADKADRIRQPLSAVANAVKPPWSLSGVEVLKRSSAFEPDVNILSAVANAVAASVVTERSRSAQLLVRV